MTVHNYISKIQNEPRQIQRLGAQRMLYRRAKFAFVMRVWLSAITLSAFGIACLIRPDLKWFAAAASFGIFFLDFFYFTRRERSYRLAGARVQEAFDCSIYQMEWSRIAGTPEPPETEIRENRDYREIAADHPPLTDWHCVPDHMTHWIAVALCQRSNVHWDTRQRTRFLAALQYVLALIWLAFFVYGLASNPRFQDLAPLAVALLPLSKLLLDQIREHQDVLVKQERVKSSAEALLKAAAAGSKQGELQKSARHLQDDIFEYRSRGPMVLDRIFKKFRNKQQEEMELAVTQIVEQLEAQRSSAANPPNADAKGSAA